MFTIKKITSVQALLLFGLLMGVFIIYPNIAQIPWDIPRLVQSAGTDGAVMQIFVNGVKINCVCFESLTGFWLFFIFRYLFFSVTIWALLIINIKKIKQPAFTRRIFLTAAVTALVYGLYILISLSINKHVDCFTIHLLFQFVVACVLCVLIGYAGALYSVQREKELEIERLKREMLQSRCDALANQINPHFFFNSLNGLTYLIRSDDKERTLEFVNKLSNVFRFILQSDKKGLVTLNEELNFLDSFRYLLEVRFADKLTFDIRVEASATAMKLPVLSLLPLVDNAVVHNAIDSEHKIHMVIATRSDSDSGETVLTVSNPTYPKLEKPVTNGTGLTNLSARFRLMVHKDIRIEQTDNTFTVILPLT